MRLVDLRTGAVVAEDVAVASGLASRMTGLIGRRPLSEGAALLIPNCRQIHTFLMRFAIDAVFVDRDMRVIRTGENVRPWRVSGYCRGAAGVIELPEGTISKHDIRTGDALSMSD